MSKQTDTPKVTARVECGECPIRYRAVCARSNEEELARLNDMKTYETYEAGAPIIWAGDPITFLGSIVSGTATLSQTLEDGRRQMVGLLLPSDFIGRPGRDTAQFDVTAASDVMICRFRKADFEGLINSSPAISQRLLNMMMDDLDAAREWMLILGRKTAREKIASFFAIVARRQAALKKHDASGQITFDLPVTREAMSDYLGLTLETVSRQVSALRKDGVIEMSGLRRVMVPDFAALLDETGDDSDGTLPA
ncbi:MAG: Crp/Fnr family transcriptional regulator [Pseudomonadota bacterium]